ncbi:MAG: DivIVA domain-containing protein [Mycobacteriales bacterium]
MDEDLLPVSHDEQPSGFDVVLRGYDRRQVDDYLDRVEVALQEADSRHAQDTARIGAIEEELTALQARLDDAERRAAGRPEPASTVGDRLAVMLRLAEEEAGAVRAEATAEAERTVSEARVRAEQQTGQRNAELDAREADLRRSLEDADKATLQAQQDAETIREHAKRDAEQLLAQAKQQASASTATMDEEMRQIREEGQREASAMTAEARRQVAELSRQRDAIAAQLQSLRDTLSGAVGPLGSAGDAGPLIDPQTQHLSAPGSHDRD